MFELNKLLPDLAAGVADAERRRRRRTAGDAHMRASDSCLPVGAAGQLSFVPSPDGAGRRGGRAVSHGGSHEYPPMPTGTGASGARPGLTHTLHSICQDSLVVPRACWGEGWHPSSAILLPTPEEHAYAGGCHHMPLYRVL